MTRKLKIDAVSDIVCPWCATGVSGLDEALANPGGEVDADLVFDPLADEMPVGCFHVVYTLPAQVAAIALPNKAAVYGLLFQAPAAAGTAAVR